MLFKVVSRVGPWICSVDGGRDRPTEKGNFWVDMGWPIVTNGEYVALLRENM